MRAPRGFVVALDGPSGVGKTAAGMRLAARIDGVFVDTGIFYRGLALIAQLRGVPSEDEVGLASLVPSVTSEIVRDPDIGCDVAQLRVDGKPVGDAIRAPEIDAQVSRVAGHPAIRAELTDRQRQAAAGNAAVVAGRDIGTVIFPEAPLKVYLDASPAERARRRALQTGDVTTDSVRESLTARDALDAGRTVAPLAMAVDAVLLETDHLSLAQVVERLEALVWERVGWRPG